MARHNEEEAILWRAMVALGAAIVSPWLAFISVRGVATANASRRRLSPRSDLFARPPRLLANR
jgi:hypothetical protein